MGVAVSPTDAPEPEVPDGYKASDVGVIPDDWEVSSVGSEFDIQLGKMLDAAKNLGTRRPYIGNRAVQWGSIQTEGLPSVALTPTDLRRYRLQVGDLLVCEGGEVGRAAIWSNPFLECYYQKALHRLRPKRDYDVALLMYLLELWAPAGRLANYVTQTSIAHLTKEKLEQLPLPVPGRREQRAITRALLDSDQLIAALDHLIEKKRAITKAAMQGLLTGRARLPGFDTPWRRATLGDEATFHKGKGLPKSALKPFGRRLCIHYGELFTNYGATIHEVLSRTDDDASAFVSIANDVLMPTSDVTPRGLAKASCILHDGVILGGDILVIRPNKGVNGSFLSYLLRYDEDQVLRLVKGTTVFHLHASDMKTFVLSLPGLKEQQAIVEALNDAVAEVSALEALREKTYAIKTGMMQALLTGALRLPLQEPE